MITLGKKLRNVYKIAKSYEYKEEKAWKSIFFNKPDTHEVVLLSGEDMDHPCVGFIGADKNWYYYSFNGLQRSEGEVTHWTKMPKQDFFSL